MGVWNSDTGASGPYPIAGTRYTTSPQYAVQCRSDPTYASGKRVSFSCAGQPDGYGARELEYPASDTSCTGTPTSNKSSDTRCYCSRAGTAPRRTGTYGGVSGVAGLCGIRYPCESAACQTDKTSCEAGSRSTENLCAWSASGSPKCSCSSTASLQTMRSRAAWGGIIGTIPPPNAKPQTCHKP